MLRFFHKINHKKSSFFFKQKNNYIELLTDHIYIKPKSKFLKIEEIITKIINKNRLKQTNHDVPPSVKLLYI